MITVKPEDVKKLHWANKQDYSADIELDKSVRIYGHRTEYYTEFDFDETFEINDVVKYEGGDYKITKISAKSITIVTCSPYFNRTKRLRLYTFIGLYCNQSRFNELRKR